MKRRKECSICAKTWSRKSRNSKLRNWRSGSETLSSQRISSSSISVANLWQSDEICFARRKNPCLRQCFQADTNFCKSMNVFSSTEITARLRRWSTFWKNLQLNFTFKTNMRKNCLMKNSITGLSNVITICCISCKKYSTHPQNTGLNWENKDGKKLDRSTSLKLSSKASWNLIQNSQSRRFTRNGANAIGKIMRMVSQNGTELSCGKDNILKVIWMAIAEFSMMMARTTSDMQSIAKWAEEEGSLKQTAQSKKESFHKTNSCTLDSFTS